MSHKPKTANSTPESQPESQPEPQPQPTSTRTWRELLIEAAQHGMSDQAAAEYAKLTPEEAEQLFHDDESLEREFLAARRAAMLRHIQAIEQVPQWQGHQYMLERQWPEEFGEKPAETSKHVPNEPDNRIEKVVETLPTDQLQNMDKVIERGARAGNATDKVTR